MSLIYNRETAVERDTKTQTDIDTSYLNEQNIVGRESDIQTSLYSFTTRTQGTFSDTLTDDIILTSISLNISSATSSKKLFVTLDNNLIASITAVANTSVSKTTFFPNSLIKAGSTFTIDNSETGGSCEIIGYYA